MRTKKVWINYMLAHNRTGLNSEIFNQLLDPLPVKELKILKKNDDLIEEVVAICKMTNTQLIKRLRDEYGFEISDCQNGDLWIDATDVNEPLTPEWVKKQTLPYEGWYLTTEDSSEQVLEPFAPWARQLLLQEVRINGFMRYFKHKLAVASEKKVKNPFEEAGAATGSLSLPWRRSGGNYI